MWGSHDTELFYCKVVGPWTNLCVLVLGHHALHFHFANEHSELWQLVRCQNFCWNILAFFKTVGYLFCCLVQILSLLIFCQNEPSFATFMCSSWYVNSSSPCSVLVKLEGHASFPLCSPVIFGGDWPLPQNKLYSCSADNLDRSSILLSGSSGCITGTAALCLSSCSGSSCRGVSSSFGAVRLGFLPGWIAAVLIWSWGFITVHFRWGFLCEKKYFLSWKVCQGLPLFQRRSETLFGSAIFCF